MLDKLRLEGKVIIHCGACDASEMEEYESYKPSLILWVEAIPRLAEHIYLKTRNRPVRHIVVNKAIFNKDNETVEFNICNQPWASSLLELGADVNKYWSYHEYLEKIKLPAVTIDTLLKENGIKAEEVGVIILDLQGAEMLAFEGAKDTLSKIPYLVSEIVYVETYKDGPKQKDVDTYLNSLGFSEVARKMHGDNLQGDALYRNENLVLHTNHPVAYESKDHTHPHGTINDNTTCPNFVNKICKTRPQITFLDLGCAGGGLVKEFHDKGILAAGLEGSDHNKNSKRAEWGTIPRNLFTADITKPFSFTKYGNRVKFDVITAWEVLEHIKEEDLIGLIYNLIFNLTQNGSFICSISTAEEYHHENVKDKNWWIDYFTKNGFKVDDEMYNYIAPDWVRGGANVANSFHLCLKRDVE